MSAPIFQTRILTDLMGGGWKELGGDVRTQMGGEIYDTETTEERVSGENREQ